MLEEIEVELDLKTHKITIKGKGLDNLTIPGDVESHRQIDRIAMLFGGEVITKKTKPVRKQQRKVIIRQKAENIR